MKKKGWNICYGWLTMIKKKKGYAEGMELALIKKKRIYSSIINA